LTWIESDMRPPPACQTASRPDARRHGRLTWVKDRRCEMPQFYPKAARHRLSRSRLFGETRKEVRCMEQVAAAPDDLPDAAGIEIAQVPFDAPWAWLAAGWRDLWSAPGISLLYGAAFAALSALLALGLLWGGLASLTLALAGGFLLIGPAAAVGLYEVSRRLEEGQRLRLGEVLTRGFRAAGQLGFFGVILAFVYFVWVQLALLLFMLFFGGQPLPPASAFVAALLLTNHGLGLLVAGTVVGGVLAALVFAISVISVPLLMTRRVDAVTAVLASLRAVWLNPKPMALWAGLIASFMALGLATLFAGLAIAFPLVGHATWHAYRDVVQAGLTP
jgi:uncharacterized membrane protein